MIAQREDIEMPGSSVQGVHPRLKAMLIVLAVAAAAAILYFKNPTTFPGWLQCPFFATTGLHCPGCGTLRAMHALLHGEVLSALDLNPLTVLTLPFLAYPFLSNVMRAVRGRPLRRIVLPGFTGWVVLALVIAFAVLRNIPVYPLTVLAP